MATLAAQVTTTIAAPPLDVWRALMNPDTLRQFFFGADVAAEWHAGGSIRYRGEWKGKSFEDKGTVESIVEGKRLVVTHWSPLSSMEDKPENYHVVALELSPNAGGTTAVLTQTNRNDDEPLAANNRAELARNWSNALGVLKKAAEAQF